MTPEEAKTVVAILKEADGGCTSCVCCLVRDFKKAFPDLITDDEILAILDNSFIDREDIEV